MKEQIIKGFRNVAILKGKKIDFQSFLEKPKNEDMGDYALPCFFLAKELKRNPIEIAKEIARDIELGEEIEKVEAFNGYVNFFVNKKDLAERVLKEIFKEKENYGRSNLEKKKRIVMIEFSQPNTHKAFHIGHIRGSVFGESLARIKEFIGEKVLRANYSGDTGMHIAKWLWCYMKFHKDKKITKEEDFAKIYVDAVKRLEDNQKGEKEVEEINRNLDERKDKKLVELWKETRNRSIEAWKPIYRDLGVEFDVHYFESEFEKEGKKFVRELLERNIAKESDGAVIVDFNREGLGVWVLLRRDGTVLYSAKDLALAYRKFKDYKLDGSLVITSAEQNLHFKQLQKTLELAKFKHWRNYEHDSYESVRLPEGKMSSRTGNNVLYAEFRNELFQEAKKEIKKRVKLELKELERRAIVIAMSAMKYSMLKQDKKKIIVFDKNESVRFEGDTGPYLLYSYARAKSILRKIKKTKGELEIGNLDESEKRIVSKLGQFTGVVERAYKNNNPSLIAHYSYQLAQIFNEFYHSGKVIGSEKEDLRLIIVECFSIVLKNALYLLSIDVLEEM